MTNISSYDHDEISNKIIKCAKNALIQPLMLIINQMLVTSEFPSDLKISRVKPLFKSGDASLFSNYRHIALLPSFSKFFEYIIFKQLYTYMNDNKLFSIEQYGFRTGHSTELAALHLVNGWISERSPQTYILICLKHLTHLITPYLLIN